MTPPDDKHIQTRRMLATIGHRAHATDPLGALVGMLPEDPMVANFLVLRQTPPDLREAAFRAAAHAAEALKMIGFEHLKEIEGGYDAISGLKILAAAYEAEVAIWPCDFDIHAVAKVSLHPDPSHQSSLRRDGFARDLRIILAALNPGFQRLPPDRRPPTLDARAFEPRPRWMFDLESELSALPDEASFGLSNHLVLAKLARTKLDLSAFAERAAACFKSSDALFVESMRAGPDMQNLMIASEGARIAAYALCAQVGIWPARKGTADREAKSRVQALVNARATTQDPLHMGAAVQLAFIRSEQPFMFTPARWDQHPLDTPWVENV
jgi:hypothetical protein